MESPYLSGSVIEGAVALVLVKTAQRSNAMTISMFSEVAHHPTALWISVAKTAYTHSLISEVNQFTLAVLHQNQKAIALACGTVSGRENDKCKTLDLRMYKSEFLLLNGALASTTCRVRQSFGVGEHTVFIADILETELGSRQAHLRHLLLSDLEI